MSSITAGYALTLSSFFVSYVKSNSGRDEDARPVSRIVYTLRFKQRNKVVEQAITVQQYL
ncbi:MAG TPA: hypothetical protein PKC69_05260 [Chitinophagaceae bacterium]|nr:hypothetical protein [Chitinophagaceae bacterium]